MPILNACPFCGRGALVKEVGGAEAVDARVDGWSVVVCPRCGARGPMRRLRPEAEAAWNARADLPVSGVTRAALRGAAWDVLGLMGGGPEFDEAVGKLGRLLGYPGY